MVRRVDSKCTYALFVLMVKGIVMEELNHKISEPRHESLLGILNTLFISRQVGGKELSPP